MIEYKTNKGGNRIFRGRVIAVLEDRYKVEHTDGKDNSVKKTTTYLKLTTGGMTESPRVPAIQAVEPPGVTRFRRPISEEARHEFNTMICAREEEFHIPSLHVMRAKEHRESRSIRAAQFDWTAEQTRMVTNPWYPEVTEPGRLFIALSVNQNSGFGQILQRLGTDFPDIDVHRNLSGPHVTLLEIFVHPDSENFGMLAEALPAFAARVAAFFRSDFDSSCQLEITGYEDFVKFVGVKFNSDSCAKSFQIFRNSVTMLLLRTLPNETRIQLKTSLTPSPQVFTNYGVNNFAVGTFSYVWEPHVSLFKKSDREEFFGLSSADILTTLRQNPELPVPGRPLFLNSDRSVPADREDFNYLFVSFYRAEEPRVSQRVYIPLL